MATVIREFAPADRYIYDFGACHFKKGWAQLDTRLAALIPRVRSWRVRFYDGKTILADCTVETINKRFARWLANERDPVNEPSQAFPVA